MNIRSHSKPPVDEKTTEEDSQGPHRSVSSERDAKIKVGCMTNGKPRGKIINPSLLIAQRKNDGNMTEIKNYDLQLEAPPGGAKQNTGLKNNESTMLRDVTNDRQLKNSETCPDQLSPKLPIPAGRSTVNNRIKKFQNGKVNCSTRGDSSTIQGKTSLSTRRNLTLDRDVQRGSIGTTAMKKQASQDQALM